MDCKYFNKCASCTLWDKNYEDQLEFKLQREKKRFKDLTSLNFEIIKSSEKNFRARAEFRIWRSFNKENKTKLSYAMNDFDKNILKIDSCEIVSSKLAKLMPQLLNKLNENAVLYDKLFSIEFLSSSIGDILVTLIYHKRLDDIWIEKAKSLENKFNIKILGRSRKQKIILSEDFIKESLDILDKKYIFNYKEGGFTQPNTKVNIEMIKWVLEKIEKSSSDLCELYCGGGNFTIPLSSKFRKVLATEISKTSINSAKLNCSLNSIENIDFIRMSSQEFTQALNKVRNFNRLKDINLDSYNFTTVLTDPPRAGCDEQTIKLLKNFDNIIYISCNPQTLHRDLKELLKTHNIKNLALFDQFPYTNHIECGVILKKK